MSQKAPLRPYPVVLRAWRSLFFRAFLNRKIEALNNLVVSDREEQTLPFSFTRFVFISKYIGFFSSIYHISHCKIQ